MSSTWRMRVSTTETTLSTGADLAAIRERKPLVHQITNYVVMNETANATLALGALPVMAHAREEVEEMAALAGALVLNIGTLSPAWVEAMLAAGRAALPRRRLSPSASQERMLPMSPEAQALSTSPSTTRSTNSTRLRSMSGRG